MGVTDGKETQHDKCENTLLNQISQETNHVASLALLAGVVELEIQCRRQDTIPCQLVGQGLVDSFDGDVVALLEVLELSVGVNGITMNRYSNEVHGETKTLLT